MRKNQTSPKGFVRRKYLYFLLFVFPAFILQGQNQTAKVTPTNSIYYYEYLPPDYASNSNDYPVVFFMHGIGERGNTLADLPNVTKNGPPKHVKNGFKFPFILISPQCKTNLSWPAWYIDEVVEHVKSTLRIDSRRIYIVGLSLGGGGAWTYAQTYPNKVAALAPVCGGFNSLKDACKLADANIPVWATHGDKDGVVPFMRSQNMVNAINACATPPTPLALLTIYPGVGHNAWDYALRTDNSLHKPNVYEWLMQFTNGSVSVNAGSDINLKLPTTSTNITGSASTGTGTISAYRWTQVSGPTATLTNNTTTTLSLTNLIEGIYTFRLTATATDGETGFDEVKVTVLKVNIVPVANAGSDLVLTLPTNATNISGTGTDVDGTIASYAWTKVSGPTATMAGTTTATLILTNLLQGTYTFRLTVKDDKGASHSNDVNVTVNPQSTNQAPLANAGIDQKINLPTSTTNLIGSGSDADGTIATYLWEKMSGPAVVLNTPNAASLSLSQLVSGTFVFKLTVTDDKGAQGSDQVTVTVVAANQSPMANAGADIILSLPTKKTSIQGTGTDADGSIASYAWSQISGPNTATLTNATSSSVTTDNLIAGTYVFSMLVTDDKGATAFDNVSVVVNALIENVLAIVNAGGDQVVTLPLNSAIITGKASDTDGTIVSLLWEKVSGASATLVGATTRTLTVNDLVAGSYVFRLTATDDDNASSTDDVSVTVMPAQVNQAPVANAGADVGVTLPATTITLIGSGTDTDGSIASYNWMQSSGPNATVVSNGASLSLTQLLEGVYTFTLTVTDNKGSTGSDEVTLTVQSANIPPVANAGADQLLNVDNTTINGSATDTDGTIIGYLWQQRSGPNTAVLVNGNTSALTISGLTTGTYTFRFTVTDNDDAKHSDDVKVIINSINLAPILSVDEDKVITLPTNTVNFTSAAVDSDGEIVTYQWTQIDGPSATLENANSPTLTVTVPTSEVYTFRIEVTDDGGAKNFEDVVLTVNAAAGNIAPIVSIAESEPITLPLNSINLSGSASDEDGSITSYLWTKVSGPTATLVNETNSTLSLSNLLEGSYTFRLTVFDNGALSSYAETHVTVLPAGVNQPPVASAGADQILILPANGITLTGSASDVDGSVLTYKWTQFHGPATSLLNADNPSLTLSALASGIYKFRLTVTDDDGATDTDDVLVNVKPAGTNQKPVADAGRDHLIYLPQTSINLEGSGSDADGNIIGYSWLKVSGPQASMDNNGLATLTVTELAEGTYVYRLEVKDDDGETHTDDVNVTVLPASINQVPQVSIDGNDNIYLPENTTLLMGTASDADGSIVTYRWEKISGPDAALLNETTSSVTVNNLVEGIYKFRLTVTDDKSASSSAEFGFTVNSETANRPPVANAGEDFAIKLPANSTAIAGSGVDAESANLTYAWIKVGGPEVIIANENSATVTLSAMEEGIYTFSLSVTDESGVTNADEVTVTVFPAHINIPPTVNAGKDVALTLPENTTTLSGTSKDDGIIQNVIWTKTNGPEINLGDASSNNLELNELKEGVYTFRYTVTDDGGLTNFDEVNVQVFAEPVPNAPPVVDAGMDIMIQLPQNSLTINAEANSPQGLIVSYQWTQVEGDPLIIPSDTLNVLEFNAIPAGEYVFRVTVTDDLGMQAFDDVHVVVLEEQPNVRPGNTFSPNGDSIDQTWKIENSFLLNDCEIVIFNRGGLKVFESTGYSNEWDGVFKGKQLEEGVYFYIIRCDYGKSITGSVMLIR
jgi:gliding motility-associated-like protein